MWQITFFIKDDPEPHIFERHKNEKEYNDYSLPEVIYLITKKFPTIIKIEFKRKK